MKRKARRPEVKKFVGTVAVLTVTVKSVRGGIAEGARWFLLLVRCGV